MKKYLALFIIFVGHIIYANPLKLVIAIDVSGSISQQEIVPIIREGYYRLIHNASIGDVITLIAFGNTPRVIASAEITDWHSKTLFIDYFSSLRFHDSYTDFNKLAYFINDKFDTSWQKIVLTDGIPAPSEHSAEFDNLMLKKLGEEALVIKVTPLGIEIPDEIVDKVHSLGEKGINIGLLEKNSFLQLMDNVLPLMREKQSEISSFINKFDPIKEKKPAGSKIKFHISKRYLIASIGVLLIIIIGYRWWSKEKQALSKVLEEEGQVKKELHLNIIQKTLNGTVIKREKINISKSGRRVSIGSSKDDTVIIPNDTLVLPHHLIIIIDKLGNAKYRLLPQHKWNLLLGTENFSLSKITDVEATIVPVEEEL